MSAPRRDRRRTYRHGVKELAYSRALPLISGLADRGARPPAYDPLLSVGGIEATGARPWAWGTTDPGVEAVVPQTGDPAWRTLEPRWFPALRILLDGRTSMRDLALPSGVTYRGVGGHRPDPTVTSSRG